MLYSVTVELTVVVDADDQDQAETIGVEGAAKDLELFGSAACDIITARKIKLVVDVPLDYLDRLPWGRSCNEKTTRELLEELHPNSSESPMCEIPNVANIIMKYVADNGYDGLVDEGSGCDCELDGLETCVYMSAHCQPGYKVPCNSGACGDHDFHIIAGKRPQGTGGEE